MIDYRKDVDLRIGSSTFYPDPDGKDRVRFEGALATVREYVERGVKIYLIDGSGEAVKVALRNAGATVWPETRKGIQESRLELFELMENDFSTNPTRNPSHVRSLAGWVEIEKVGFATQCLDICIELLLQDADVSVPTRSDTSLGTLPWYQEQSERKANHVARLITGLPFLDTMFGPVFFLRRYLGYLKDCDTAKKYSLRTGYFHHLLPFYVNALGQDRVIPARYGQRLPHVATPVVDYHYNPAQTEEENGPRFAEMNAKRDAQFYECVSLYFHAAREYYRYAFDPVR